MENCETKVCCICRQGDRGLRLQPVSREEEEGQCAGELQVGERVSDLRVFRWSISVDGQDIRYIDNRGERDIALPAPFDFG